MSHNVFPIEVTIEVDDPDSVLEDFDQIQVHRSTTDAGGQYAEVTKPDHRVNLQSGQKRYTFTDDEGSGDYWYKFRYYNSNTFAVSTFSDPQPGQPDPALDVISIHDLKTFYLFGLDLTNDQGVPFPDSLYAHFIKGAVSWLEHKLDIPIRRTVVDDEWHDYQKEDYKKYIWFETDLYPVISVESIKMVLPGNQVVQTFDKSWIHMARESGQIQIVPGAGGGGTLLLGIGAAWLPLVYGGQRAIPDVFRIAYTAGFGQPPPNSFNPAFGANPPSVSKPDPQLDKQAHIIKELVGKIAAFGPLNIAGDLIGGAGIASQSLSIDGLSQSVNTTSSPSFAGYGARLIQYRQEIKDQVPTLQKYYHGLRMRVA